MYVSIIISKRRICYRQYWVFFVQFLVEWKKGVKEYKFEGEDMALWAFVGILFIVGILIIMYAIPQEDIRKKIINLIIGVSILGVGIVSGFLIYTENFRSARFLWRFTLFIVFLCLGLYEAYKPMLFRQKVEAYYVGSVRSTGVHEGHGTQLGYHLKFKYKKDGKWIFCVTDDKFVLNVPLNEVYGSKKLCVKSTDFGYVKNQEYSIWIATNNSKRARIKRYYEAWIGYILIVGAFLFLLESGF